MSYDKFYELFETQIDRNFPSNQIVKPWQGHMIPQAFYRDDETRQQAIDYLINNGYRLHRENNLRYQIDTQEQPPNRRVRVGNNVRFYPVGYKFAYVENKDGTINQYLLPYTEDYNNKKLSRKKMLSEGTIKPVSSMFAKKGNYSIVNPGKTQNNVLNPDITKYIEEFKGLNWKPTTRLFETEYDRYANVAPDNTGPILPQAFFEKNKTELEAIDNRQKAINFLLGKGYKLFRENQDRTNINTIPDTKNHVYAYVENDDGSVNQYIKYDDSERNLNILRTQIKDFTGGKKQRKNTKKNKRSTKKGSTKNNKRSMKKHE